MTAEVSGWQSSSGRKKKELRMYCDGDSQPVDVYHAQWPVRRSFGPIRKPQKLDVVV